MKNKFLLLFAFFILAHSIFSDHGPLTTGAGATLIEPTTLKRFQLSAALAIAVSQYERLSDADIQELTLRMNQRGSHVDSIRQSLLSTVSAAIGVTDSLEAGMRYRYYRGEEVREGLIDSGGTYRSIRLGNIGGTADPDLYLKYRVLKTDRHTLTFAGFAKVPLGKYYTTHEAKPLSAYAPQLQPKLHLTGGGNAGDPLSEKYSIEPSLTPGSGAWDFSGAVAWSMWLGEGASLTASVLYTRRTAAQNYKVGDSVEGGFSLQRRWGSRDEANFSLFTELTARHLMPAVSFSEAIGNTGGTMFFLSPGVVFAWPAGLSVSCFVQLPVLRYVNEPQQYLAYRAGFSVAYMFGI
ncbi:transporter [Turneriella parva]|uniref:Transporter n=1 Tax=Turneriella parva (strain ATCC BAA-1111 / DSM 21527 / NCTC 11395 / H) TaxID=869212 RepID=I4B1U0_TURPD|nr:transporter [Turneriella parva]AFM11247.1 hypothetical protein Turpa_0595 [Turneriella parva DSM 21527]